MMMMMTMIQKYDDVGKRKNTEETQRKSSYCFVSGEWGKISEKGKIEIVKDEGGEAGGGGVLEGGGGEKKGEGRGEGGDGRGGRGGRGEGGDLGGEKDS